jgi:hypothetical protein
VSDEVVKYLKDRDDDLKNRDEEIVRLKKRLRNMESCLESIDDIRICSVCDLHYFEYDGMACFNFTSCCDFSVCDNCNPDRTMMKTKTFDGMDNSLCEQCYPLTWAERHKQYYKW